MNFILTHWVNSFTLQEFVKNPDAPCCVVVLVKGIAINGERRLAWHAGISHKSMFNCGFQDYPGFMPVSGGLRVFSRSKPARTRPEFVGTETGCAHMTA